MPRLSILTDEEKHHYDHPPILTQEERAIYFSLTQPLEKKINSLQTLINKIGFLLQYGYFSASKRFFSVNYFHQEDIKYVATLFGATIDDIDRNYYKINMSNPHQQSILEMQNFKPLKGNELNWFLQEINRRVERFTDPRQIFFELLQLLYDHTIELPSYHKLSDLISQYYNNREINLMAVLKKELPTEHILQLDNLLKTEPSKNEGVLNALKYINQSKKPKAINASIGTFTKIAELFNQGYPFIHPLNLTPNSIGYYATWVKKSKLSQLKQFSEPYKMYLYVMSFIQDTYYLRQDAFVDIFLKSVQTAKNTTRIRLQASDQLTRGERKAAVKHLNKKNKGYKQLIDAITDVTKSHVLTDTGKVERIAELIAQYEKEKDDIQQEKLTKFEKSLDDMINDNQYFDILEKLSIKLQNKVSGILKILDFNALNSNEALMKAIQEYTHRGANVDQTSPMDFLNANEKAAVFDKQGKFRPSLYKILLYLHVADSIKSGELNLKHSYRYLSINDYLIDEKTWENEQEKLLKSAGLTQFKDCNTILAELKIRLDEKYHSVNQRWLDGKNPYLSIDKKNVSHIKTPAVENTNTEHITAFLSHMNYIPLLDILSEINTIVGFTHHFKHHGVKNIKRRPKDDIFTAGIIGLGCNIGVPKMAQISTGINENTLRNTVNWYFSLKNMVASNESIVAFIDKLALPNIFILNKNNKHASSDGRKVSVAVDCLLANRSFKYFGHESGVSIYTFIDERQVLFYSTVISASDREAAYVIDGLNNNNVIKIDIHSTDSHGYTELIFATTHFFETSFAPRLKNIGKQKTYGFSSKETYEKKGFKILPSRTINQTLIQTYWNDILRFMVTIKLKEVSASQLFKRLSSYAKSNPLYKAIKEFGRIIKSLFILTYYDDINLRQRIEKQLNRIEQSNKFGRAVFYAGNGEFKQASHEEQQVITACTVLIQNAIVLWNYLYLSQLIANCKDEKERNDIINMIRDGSVMTWAHVNLHGEFDFRRRAANERFFDLEKILKLAA